MGFLLVIPPVVACCQRSTLACNITNPRLCSKKNYKESSALNLWKTGSQASDLYGKAKISYLLKIKSKVFGAPQSISPVIWILHFVNCFEHRKRWPWWTRWQWNKGWPFLMLMHCFLFLIEKFRNKTNQGTVYLRHVLCSEKITCCQKEVLLYLN